MCMVFSVVADVVVLLHLLFVLFVMLGGILAFKWKWIMWVHLPAACWGALIELAGWVCPLTPIENWLREAGGGEGYRLGFIEHYIMPVLYPIGLTRDIQVFLGIGVILFNAGLYTVILSRHKRLSK